MNTCGFSLFMAKGTLRETTKRKVMFRGGLNFYRRNWFLSYMGLYSAHFISVVSYKKLILEVPRQFVSRTNDAL